MTNGGLHVGGRGAGEDDVQRLGQVLIEAGLINRAQEAQIISFASEHDMRFGEAAVALGVIDEATLHRALATQFDLQIANGDFGGEPIAFTAPGSVAAEDYRSIRNALTLRWFKHPQGAQTLAVISPQRADGRSLMAANLAVCCAQVGFKTLLIDADMRTPSQHRLFRLEDQSGLATLLAGRLEQSPYQEIPGIPSLSVLPVGGIPPNPQELLLRPYLQRLVDHAKLQFEMIIFDTPAAEAGSDYQIIGAVAEGALVVTRAEQTRTRNAKRMVQACRDFGIRMVGSAMVSRRAA